MDTTQQSLSAAQEREETPAQGSRRLDRMIALTSLGVVLSLVLVFAVPIWWQLEWHAPVSAVIMLATIVGVVCVQWIDVRALIVAPPGMKLAVWSIPTAFSKYRRGHLVPLVSIGTTFFLLGSLWIAFGWFNSGRDWDSLGMGSPYMVVGSLLLLIFASLWRREGSAADKAFARPFVIGPVILLAFSLIILSIWQVPKFLGALQVGPVAPWTQQWNLVQQAVDDKYPGAVLWSLSASREYNTPPSYDAALNTNFFFTLMDGRDLGVELRDTKPEATLDLWGPSDYDRSSQNAQEDADVLRALSSRIYFGPRDALLAAQAELGADAPALGDLGPIIQLQLAEPDRTNNDTFAQLGRSAVWQVTIYSDDPNSSRTVWVDAETGEVLLVEQSTN